MTDDDKYDIEITRELAAMLGLPLRFVDAAAVPYEDVGEEVRRRTEGMDGAPKAATRQSISSSTRST